MVSSSMTPFYFLGVAALVAFTEGEKYSLFIRVPNTSKRLLPKSFKHKQQHLKRGTIRNDAVSQVVFNCNLTQKFSGWTLLNRGNSPYKNFDPKEDSAEFKLDDPNGSLSATGTFSITIQFMEVENDAVMAELKITNNRVSLSVVSISYCHEEVDDEAEGEEEGEEEGKEEEEVEDYSSTELSPPVLLEQIWKLDFNEEEFLFPTVNGDLLSDLHKFEDCGDDDYGVDDLRLSILSRSLARIKINFQASEGISASYRKLEKGIFDFC